jgi:hypothetical protein
MRHTYAHAIIWSFNMQTKLKFETQMGSTKFKTGKNQKGRYFLAAVLVCVFVGLLAKSLATVDNKAAENLADTQTTSVTDAKSPTTSIAPVSFNVTADPGVEYVVFDVQKRPDGLIEVLSRRRGSSGTSYARRLVDCQNWKFMYLAEGDTVAELSVLHPDARMAELTAGSSSTAVSYNGCKLAGMTD